MARKPQGNAATKPNADQIAAAVESGFVPVIRVVGPAKGRRRAGHHFGQEPVDLPLADLTEADVAALESDPELVTVIMAVAADVPANDADTPSAD